MKKSAGNNTSALGLSELQTAEEKMMLPDVKSCRYLSLACQSAEAAKIRSSMSCSDTGMVMGSAILIRSFALE